MQIQRLASSQFFVSVCVNSVYFIAKVIKQNNINQRIMASDNTTLSAFQEWDFSCAFVDRKWHC